MKSYMPLKLPLEAGLVNPLMFLNELIEANTALGQYQIMAKHMKIQNELILQRLLLLQEAIQSSKIEGIEVTFDELLESEVQSRKRSSKTQQALNYFNALSQGERLLRDIPISKELFTNLHAALFSNESVSDYRKVQNYIGKEGCTLQTATFVPPEPQLVTEYMSNLEHYINDDKEDVNHLVRIAIIHAQFETIHPFLDGNGRLGRILIPLYLYDKKVIDTPSFFVSDTLEKYKYRYYQYLNDVRFKQSWNQWIRFFLKSVTEQAKKNMSLIEELDELYERDINHICRVVANNNVKKIVDVMFTYPIFTAKLMMELTGIKAATCRRYLKILEQEGFVFSDERKRGKTYYYYNLLVRLR